MISLEVKKVWPLARNYPKLKLTDVHAGNEWREEDHSVFE